MCLILLSRMMLQLSLVSMYLHTWSSMYVLLDNMFSWLSPYLWSAASTATLFVPTYTYMYVHTCIYIDILSLPLMLLAIQVRLYCMVLEYVHGLYCMILEYMDCTVWYWSTYMDCTAWYWSTWTVLHGTGVHGLYCMVLEYMDCTA